MAKFLLKFSIFIISAAFVFVFFLPGEIRAQTTQSLEESFLRVKIQLLQLQVELLKAQISLFLKRETQNCAQLSISWERVSGANSYRLYRDGVLIYEGNARSFADSGLTLRKKYRYVVHGMYRGVEGEPSEVKEITAPNICPPQTPRLNFQAEPCGGNLTLTWPARARASTYQVFRANREIYSGPLTRFVDSRLRPNTTYEYKIRAGNVGGWSNFSSDASFQSSSVCGPSALKASPVITFSATEGALLLEMRSSPRNNVRVRPDSTNQSVMAFEAQAAFSDITVSRIDLFFDSPVWLYLDRVEIRFGGITLAEKAITQESLTRIGSEHIYQLRFEWFSAVVREGGTGTFTVRVDAKEFALAPLPHNISVFLENNSVRGIDQARIFQLAPVSGGGKGGVFSRTFRIE